jgi:putative ABC transport system substrate-binding protein
VPTGLVGAQQPKKVTRVGYLSSLSPSSDSARAKAIRQALHELGYVDGQNITIEYRYAEGKRDSFSELAADLVRLRVDIIVVAAGDVLTRTAKNATTTIPIVMTGQGADPVAAGLIESVARPGGNVTGLTNLSGDLGGKRLELLKEAVPKVTRVAVLYDPTIPPNVREVKDVLPGVARALGLTLRPLEVNGANDFDKVFAAMDRRRPDGLYVPEGPLMRINGKRIAGLALKQRLPSVYDNRAAVDAGGLMHYGADLLARHSRNRVGSPLRAGRPR